MNNHAVANTTRTVNACAHATHRILTPLLAIASPIFLSALLLPAPALAQTGVLCTPTYNETGGVSDLYYAIGEVAQINASATPAASRPCATSSSMSIAPTARCPRRR